MRTLLKVTDDNELARSSRAVRVGREQEIGSFDHRPSDVRSFPGQGVLFQKAVDGGGSNAFSESGPRWQVRQQCEFLVKNSKGDFVIGAIAG